MTRDFSFYFPGAPLTNAWGVSSSGIGHGVISPFEEYPPRRHPVDHMFSWENGRILQSYQVLYISKGKGQFESIHTGVLDINAGDFFVLFPGEWHRYKPNPETGWTEDWIELSGSTILKLRSEGLLSPSEPIFSVGIAPEFIEIFDRCRSIAQQETIDFSVSIGLYALQLIAFAKLSASRLRSVDEDVEMRISKAKALIGERISLPIVMESLAEEVGISYSSFRRTFKERTGFAPKQYQLQLRHRKAQDLLANTALPLDAIAQLLGFDSAFHLSADFKKRTGIPPKTWRASYRDTHKSRHTI